MKWALFDTVDNLWIGTDERTGALKVFDSEDVFNGQQIGEDAEKFARVAAQIARARLGWDYGRIAVREFTETGPLRVRDELPVRDTTKNVLRKIEQGVII